MLTNNERTWLKNRKSGDWCLAIDCSAWCDRTEGHSSTPYCFSKICYMDNPDFYRDSAEFESRVARKLADLQFEFSQYVKGRGHVLSSPDMRMKYARLKVEEEMDGKA